MRNCKSVTNPDFATPIQIGDKKWELVKRCPIFYLPEDVGAKAIYLTMARKFRFSPNQVDSLPVSTLNYFLASIQAEYWQMQFQKKQMEVVSKSGKKGRR